MKFLSIILIYVYHGKINESHITELVTISVKQIKNDNVKPCSPKEV